MISISKKEMEYLVSKGVNFGEGGISRTSSHHNKKHYFLCESKRNMQKHYDYERMIGINTDYKKR